MKGYQKKIIIFSTIDSIISIPLVYHVVSQKKYKKFKFDIIFMKSNFIRKIKVLIVIILFGSIIQLIKKIFSGKKIKDFPGASNNIRLQPSQRQDAVKMDKSKT